MPADLVQASQIMQDALLRELGDEVDIILYFGSHLKQETHKYSDLDICYIPVNDSTWNHITVLVGDTLMDLFAIHWAQFEQMADFDNVLCTVLMNSQIVYRRSEEAANRFYALRERHRALQQPEARPGMMRKAQKIFQQTGYQYYLLRQQAERGHQLAAMQHAQTIVKTVLHTLAVYNQACIDTRKLDQVLALPELPAGFAGSLDSVMKTADPVQRLLAVEHLLQTTRALLLAGQPALRHHETTFPAIFDGAYPELKGDIQHLMLACEREDSFNFNLLSLYHELMIHMAWAISGIGYSDFNSIAEYEQDLAALGFPDLLPTIAAEDFAGLHEQCRLFDQRLREYLVEQGVPLNTFATTGDLQSYLEAR